jgi:NADH-quinone oxidoreductase subunit L
MWVPLAILAACAVGIGFFAEWSGGFAATSVHPFSAALATTPSLAYSAVQETTQPGAFHMNVAITSSLVALLGVAIAAFLFLGPQKEAASLARLFNAIPVLSPYKLSQNKFYWDEIYNGIIVRPLRGLAVASYAVDRWFVDGIVNFVGWVPRVIGSLMRSLQIGLVPFYALAMVLGVLTLLAARMLWGNG